MDYFEIKKMTFLQTAKHRDELALIFKEKLDRSVAGIKQTNLRIHFEDGVSESRNVNDLFATMCRYVRAREEIKEKE